MAFPPRRAANTHQPVRCQGSRRRASEGCPSFTPAAHRGQTQEGGFLDAPGGASDGPPSVGCAPPASSSAGQPAFGT